MKAKTVWIIILIGLLLFVAASPLGQICVDVGHAFISFGHGLKSIGANFHA